MPDVIGRRRPGPRACPPTRADPGDEHAGRDAGADEHTQRSAKLTGVEVGNSTGIENSLECVERCREGVRR
jgi:hypothetical protein